MSYRTLLVHLDMGGQARARIDFAVRLAAVQEAHLVAVFSSYIAEPQSFYLKAELAEPLERIRTERAANGRELQAYLNEAGRRADVKVEWRTTTEHPNVALPLHARHADLVILGQPDKDDAHAYVAPNFVPNALLSAGRPVLMVPYIGAPATFGMRPLIGWDCSRAATRAVYDALPFLRRAKRCDLLTINASDEATQDLRLPGSEIATTLARHGVTVETHTLAGIPHRELGSTLLSKAADLSSDLIVVGAYGHARLSELLLGGVTRSLLDAMTVPVLFSH